MVDITDPVLRAGKESKRIETVSFQKTALFILGIICICAIAWGIFIFMTAHIDTVPNNSIDVSKQINSIEFDGRIPAIPNTVSSSSNR